MSLKVPARPDGRKMWCGPTALAILAGLDYDTAYTKMTAAINRDARKQARERGLPADYWVKKAYKGVGLTEIRVAGKALGLKIEWEREKRDGWKPRSCPFKHKGVTLLTFIRDHTVRGKVYLVDAGNHYVVVKDGVVFDNTRTGPASIEEYPRAKLGRLTCYAEVKPHPGAMQ